MGFDPTSYLLSLQGKSSCTEIVCLFLHDHHLASTGTGRSFGRLHRAPRPFAMAATSSWPRGRRWHRCAQQIRRQASYPKDLVSAWQEWQKWAHKWRNEKQGWWLAGGSYSLLFFFGKFSCTVVTTREWCDSYAWLLISSWCSFSAWGVSFW